VADRIRSQLRHDLGPAGPVLTRAGVEVLVSDGDVLDRNLVEALPSLELVASQSSRRLSRKRLADEDSWGRHGSRDPEAKPRFLDCRRCQPVDGGNVGCSTHHLTVVTGDCAVGQVYSILEADAHEITAER
jgi:hypothetical protein